MLNYKILCFEKIFPNFVVQNLVGRKEWEKEWKVT